MPDHAPRLGHNFARRADWNLLKLYVEIVRAGGIGAAARRLNRQQPSISAALKRLEDQVGAQLLHRSASGVRTTAAGKALLQLCEDMFEAARMVPHQIAQAVQRVEGLVRMQIISSIISPEFDEAIASFHRRYPAIQIELRVSVWGEILEALDRGDVELGVGYDGAARTNLTYDPLFIEAQQLYCSRHHPFYGRQTSRLIELRDQGFVLTGADEPVAIAHLRTRYGLGTLVNGRAEDVHEALRLISLGVGIGFLPTVAADAAVRSGRLWPMLQADTVPAYDIFLISRTENARDTATQLFLDEIRRRLRAATP